MKLQNSYSGIFSSRVVSITVCYHPDVELLKTQLSAFDPSMTKILIDNTGGIKICENLETLKLNISNLHIFFNKENLGLAAALNQGVSQVPKLDPAARFVFLLDQDSVPIPGCLQELLKSYGLLVQRGENVGAVGPYLQDRVTGQFHGFHQMTRWRWRRVFPVPSLGVPTRCINLNGSGTLMRVDLFLGMGGLDETLFIDHVDTEWGFRMVSQGYSLWGVPSAIMQHQMGENSIRFWLGGWKVWPMRSPVRHRFLFKNAVVLMRRDYVPRLWKIWAVAKLLMTVIVHGLLDKQRVQQVQAMVGGITAGIRS